MNLTSCDGCGVVLDKDKLPWPDDLWDLDEEGISQEKAEWNGDKWVAFTECPVCGTHLLKTGE